MCAVWGENWNLIRLKHAIWQSLYLPGSESVELEQQQIRGWSCCRMIEAPEGRAKAVADQLISEMQTLLIPRGLWNFDWFDTDLWADHVAVSLKFNGAHANKSTCLPQSLCLCHSLCAGLGEIRHDKQQHRNQKWNETQ